LRSVPYRAKLVLLTLYCLTVLLFCIHYSTTFTASIQRLIHSPPLLPHGNFCVLPNAFDGGEKRNREGVTLVLHISADYIEEKTLLSQVSNWAGPVSIAVYFDDPMTQLNCIDEMLHKLSIKKSRPLKQLRVHYYTTNEKCEFLLSRSGSCSNEGKKNKSVEEIAAYPANVGRNIAREFIHTDFILLADYEHLFSHGFERRMTQIAARENITERKSVLVYRIFEIDQSAESPKNKKDLASLLSSKKAVVFHDRFYKGGHSIPGLDEWLKKKEGEGDGIAKRNLSMKARSSWEPQFVSPSTIPMHDEAFPYMIRDNTCLRWELCRAGFSLLLVDDLFMFHRGIKTAKDIGKTKQIQSTNKKRFYRALDAFKKRMDSKYPSTKDWCPSFRA
ncbi:hypothetical protein PMAYCL1PPCAC_12278, partial [Pristionchus mayeri]